MTLKIVAEWDKQGAETTKEQAERVLRDLRAKISENGKIGLLYSANQRQVKLINKLKQGEPQSGKETVSKILARAGGQGAFYRELYTLLEKPENKELLAKIEILPIATSRRGGANKSGNVVFLDDLNTSLDELSTFATEHPVYGFLRKDTEDEFAIGGSISVLFYHDDHGTDVRERDPNRVVAHNKQRESTTQGAYVQSQLKQIRAEQPLEKIEENIYSRSVRQALAEYQENVNKVKTRFSFLHRHGGDGLTNAYVFLDKVLFSGQSMDTIKQTILNHLESGPGNTHAHSFKTILLEKLLKNAEIVGSFRNYNERVDAFRNHQLPADLNQEEEKENIIRATL